jgi:hypothetical protein
MKVQLPEVKLPEFSGDFNDWGDFRRDFDQLVGIMSELVDPKVKLIYLRSCLKGDAKSIECKEETFDSLWKALTNTYENKRYVVNHCIDAIIGLKVMSRGSSADLKSIINIAKKNVRTFTQMGLEVNPLTEAILIHIVIEKLDFNIRNDFELSLKQNELPSWKKFVEFLEKRSNSLEAIESSKKKTTTTTKKEDPGKKSKSFNAHQANNLNKSPETSSNKNSENSKNDNLNSNLNVNSKKNNFDRLKNLKCYLCNGNHYLSLCKSFTDLNLSEKWNKVKELGLCANCLAKAHKSDVCPRFPCTECSEFHHNLLHGLKQANKNSNENKSGDQGKPKNFTGSVQTSSDSKQVLLGTALIYVYDNSGNKHICRCLLDSGAMSNFISESLAQRLGLKRDRMRIDVVTLNDSQIAIKQSLNATIESRFSKFQRSVEFLIVPQVASLLPMKSFSVKNVNFPRNVQLADETFHVSGRIDMLLGMEHFHDIFRSGSKIVLGEELPVLEETELGYVASGIVKDVEVGKRFNGCNFVGLSISNEELHQDLKKFWELEDVSSKKALTIEEREVEKHFESTHYRYPDGRYGVFLPFKSEIRDLGSSKELAIKRFLNLEKKLDRNLPLKAEYKKFIDEYMELNHMEKYADNVETVSSEGHYFLPHHAVLKPSSSTTKLRVVFDGSALTKNGMSLNSITKNGPVVQSDYLNLLLRFRCWRYAFSSDAVKMYRQIRVHPSQRCYQVILWRDNSSEPIQVRKLCTATYGTKCAGYVSTRCLNQLSMDEDKFPLASEIVRRDFYVDDCLSGAETLEQAIQIRDELIGLLKRGKIELHKWCSNSQEFLKDIPADRREMKADMNEDATVKALGMVWLPVADKFIFEFDKDCFEDREFSKRSVLSDIAKFFDPLGILEPIKLSAKIFMQRLWEKQYNWDSELDDEDKQFWSDYRGGMKEMSQIAIDRFVLTSLSPKEIQIHGFSDACMNGYGACVYVRCVDSDGKVKVTLLCSRSRVAPLSSKTIPRLELCAATLLANLYQTVKASLVEGIKYKTYLWTDSMITLAWIRMRSRNLKTFVAHRVADIQELTCIEDWRFVGTADNPADVLSRGLKPSEIKNCSIWWKGPEFLQRLESDWPTEQPKMPEEIPEVQNLLVIETKRCELLELFSSYRKTVKVTAMIYRFYNNCRNKLKGDPLKSGRISSEELLAADICLLRCVQLEAFSDEVKSLRSKSNLKKDSKLLVFAPFLDGDGLLRVGGRISRAPIPVDQKHPILLPKGHPYTTLLIRCFHEENLHAGTQFILCFLRRRYWVLNGRNAVKKVIHSCIQCFRKRPKLIEQYMSDLPEVRLERSPVFMKTGVDFCGPFMIKANPRGTIKTKAWISVFQCLVTRSIHLELASGMSSEDFINVLYRFVSRRGFISDMYSDNGTNFVGANNDLKEYYDWFSSQENFNEISKWCDIRGIKWHFIPPSAPHMGGTWESAVKLVKTLLPEVYGDSFLTYEEFYTVLCRIEMILNSRPITKMTDDFSDITALTPGHFLIGRPINDVIEPDYTDFNPLRLSRFQRLQQLKQVFWKRFFDEYLHQLQMRFKWHSKIEVRVGQVVIIKDENVPSTHWLLGKIETLHPGSDDVTRVVTLRTKNGTIVRPLAKLCFLPISDNADDKSDH